MLDDSGLIRSTREPHASHGPAFALIRDGDACAWAVNADVPSQVARELNALASDESPSTDVSEAPRHAGAYVALLGGRVDSGPVFTFPATIPEAKDVRVITAISDLERHFRGWAADELPERSPILGIEVDRHTVSVCFCARRSDVAAEAGVETAVAYRGRGLGARVTAAWAQIVRNSGRLPLYSTSWSNASSLSVAKRLGLSACAADWSIYVPAG